MFSTGRVKWGKVKNTERKRENETNNIAYQAADIDPHFVGGIKQLESVGINNKIILDYSIHDAIIPTQLFCS